MGQACDDVDVHCGAVRLNGVQLGATLFLMTAGLTLTLASWALSTSHTVRSIWSGHSCALMCLCVGLVAGGVSSALASVAVIGALLEIAVFRRLYARSHLDQVLATFALILISTD